MRVAWDRAPPVRRAAYGSERVPARGIRRAAGTGQHLREHQSRSRASAIAPGSAESPVLAAHFFHHKDTEARRSTRSSWWTQLTSFWRETKDPEGVKQDSPGRSPGFKVQIAESPERAAQGVRSQLQINARHKARLWYRDQLHRPFGASVVTVLFPGLAPWVQGPNCRKP